MAGSACQRLLRPGVLWRAGDARAAAGPVVPAGTPGLDEALPGGGWPLGALTEVCADAEGIGELSLFVPALARLAAAGRFVVWVGPPHRPCAPALAARGVDPSRLALVRVGDVGERLWSAEQALACGACGAVLLWVPAPGEALLDPRRLRRLQIAAERGRVLGVLFRGAEASRRASPAALRIGLEPGPQGLRVRVLKCRGRAPGAVLTLPRPDASPARAAG